MADPLQELETPVCTLDESCLTLTSLVKDIRNSRVKVDRWFENKLDDTRLDISQACKQLSNLKSRFANNEQRLHDRLRGLEDRLDVYKVEMHERDETIEDLKRQLREANRKLAQNDDTNGLAALLSTATSSSAGKSGRQDRDSGFFEFGSSSTSGGTDPEETMREEVARTLFEEGKRSFSGGYFHEAEKSFREVQNMVLLLPGGLRSDLAYYRAVCQAEINNDCAAKKALSDFLLAYDDAAIDRRAHIKHLLAQACVKLDQLEEAYSHSLHASGLWREIGKTDGHYLDSVALLARILDLQQKPDNAIAIIKQWCPADRRSYVRDKYASLVPINTVSQSGQQSSSNQRTTTPAHTTATPTRSAKPAEPHTRPTTHLSSSVVSLAGTSSTARRLARRTKKAEELPLMFRWALT